MRTRIAAIVAVLAGIALIGTVIITSLFSRTSAWERLSDATRPAFSDEAITTQQADVAALDAFATDLPQALSLLAQQAQLSEEQLAAFLAGFPEVQQGLQQLPALATGLRDGAAIVAAEQDHFRRADAIVTEDTPSTAVPWFMLITGALAIVLGLSLMQGNARLRIATIALGLIIVATPVVTSLPSKSANADALNDGVAPLFTTEQVAALRAAATTLESFGERVQTELLPAIGGLLNTPPSAVAEGLGTFFPTIGEALARGPQAVERLREQANLLEATIDDYTTASGAAYAPIAWITIVMGIAVALAGLVSTVGRGAMGESAAAPRTTRRLRRAA